MTNINRNKQNLSLGRYIPNPDNTLSIADLEKWEFDQKIIVPWISSFYKKRFEEMAPALFQVITLEAQEFNILDLG